MGLVLRRLVYGQSLRQLAQQRDQAAPTLRKRFRRELARYLANGPAVAIPAGPFALLMDGVWFRFGRQPWTLYVMALKPQGKSFAIFLDPVLLPGKESLQDWQRVVARLPPEIRAQVQAVISDGIRGAKTLARDHGWLHQRCHFHLIAQLQGRRGRRRTVTGRSEREAIYQAIREALETLDEVRLAVLTRQLRRLAGREAVPERLRMITRDFLRELGSFRTYRRHPNLSLPTTTNVIESMANLLRQRIRSVSTPAALQRWATALFRLRPTMTCNGKTNQPD
jgi:hypothetical protein